MLSFLAYIDGVGAVEGAERGSGSEVSELK